MMEGATTAPVTGTISINLSKGENINLSKGNPGLQVIHLGLGWDPQGNGQPFDLDAFAMCLNAQGKLTGTERLLYFNTTKDASGVLSILDGALKHSGDNREGVGDGDDETIIVDLSKVPADVEKVVLAANIFDSTARNQNFGQVKNAFIRGYNPSESNKEMMRFDLSEDFSGSTCVIFGELYKKDEEWKFRALGEGRTQDIAQCAASFQ